MATWRTWWTFGLGALDLHLGYQRNDRREYDNHGPLALRNVPAFGLKLFTYTADARLNHGKVGRVHGTVGASYLHQANINSGKGFLIPQCYDLRWQRVFEFSIGGQTFPGEERTYDGVAVNVGWSFLISDAWSLAGTMGRRAPHFLHDRGAHGVSIPQ